jgi:hypothetical protein
LEDVSPMFGPVLTKGLKGLKMYKITWEVPGLSVKVRSKNVNSRGYIFQIMFIHVGTFYSCQLNTNVKLEDLKRNKCNGFYKIIFKHRCSLLYGSQKNAISF